VHQGCKAAVAIASKLDVVPGFSAKCAQREALPACVDESDGPPKSMCRQGNQGCADANQRTIIPLFRRGKAKQSLEGSLAEQLQRIEGEAGVRSQL
jgi:hypothetical protein